MNISFKSQNIPAEECLDSSQQGRNWPRLDAIEFGWWLSANVAQLWVMNRWTAISHYFCKDHDKSNVQASLASHWNKTTCFIFKLAKSINNEASTEAPNSTTFSMWCCRKGGSVSQRCVHKTARHYKFLMIDECGTWISLSSERLVTMTACVILHNIQ